MKSNKEHPAAHAPSHESSSVIDFHSRTRVVFGAGDPKGGAAGGALNLLQFPTLNHRCEITAGVRLEECRGLLQTFFAEQRTRPQNGSVPKTP